MANTYGNNGNRWWVGQNVGETGSQQTAFGTPSIAALNPSTPSGYESLPSGNATDDAKFAAAAKTNKGSTKPNTISVENVQWFNIQGPFTTQAAANSAIAAIQKANPSPGVLGQVSKDNSSNPLGQAASAITSTEGFFNALGDANLWIRVAKVIAGGVILTVGLLKLTGGDKAIGGVAAKAVKVAPLL
jgi:hypothetical protein